MPRTLTSDQVPKARKMGTAARNVESWGAQLLPGAGVRRRLCAVEHEQAHLVHTGSTEAIVNAPGEDRFSRSSTR